MKLLDRRIRCILLLVCLAGGCRPEAEAPAVSAPPVVLAPVQLEDLDERIEATGELLARNRASLAAEVAGRVSEIVFDEGQAVEAGAVILEIDPERRQLELANAKAQVSEARAAFDEQQRELQRVKTLHEREIASDARLDQTRTALQRSASQLEASVAQLRIAERALADASMRAAFDGHVARRWVSRGEYVNVGQKLVDLVALDPIEIEFHLAERDSARVAMGQEVLVRVDPYPDELFAARVTVISPTMDSRTRTLRVLARLDNNEGRLRPGLFARADLGIARRSDVMWVPEESILQRADGAVVFRLMPEGRVARTPVDTGVHRAGFVEVREGLEATDRVVTRGHAALVDGSAVSPRHLDGSPVLEGKPALEGIPVLDASALRAASPELAEAARRREPTP